jgi:MoaA/NifB/PqqE/SkfB family radical SAM enzyme
MTEQVQDYLHPLVDYIKSRLESLLTLVEFEEGGKPIEPDSFRLNNLSSWSFEKYNSVFDSLGSFSSHCNLKCKFCYEDGNPIGYEKTLLTLEEADTRTRYYRKNINKGLPLFRQRIYKEPFTNRDLLPILKNVRATCPEVEIHLTTNGSLLSEELLCELSELLPINLCISLNSSDPKLREELMLDKRSKKSIDMITKFQKYGLPYAGSIVAWPEINVGDIVRTIRFLDKNNARMIRISLPGFSKYYSLDPPFETKPTWQNILDKILPLREEISTPILILPSLYHSKAFLPEVAGIIRNSPAGRSGMRFGDIIITVNGQNTASRSEAQELLFSGSRTGHVEVEFKRGEKTLRTALGEAEASEQNYPYRPSGYPASKAHPMGIILVDDFNPMWLVNLLGKLATLKAENILLMTSAIMEPLVASLLDSISDLDQLLGGKNLFLWIPEHRFWGGNIILGDLYTCNDFIEGVKDFARKNEIKPDLIVIPESFSPNGYTDMLGVSYSVIEHETGVPVLLAKCSTITM